MEQIDNSSLGRSWSIERLRALHDDVEVVIRNPKTGTVKTRIVNFDEVCTRAEWAVERYLRAGDKKVIGTFFTNIIWTFRCGTAMTDGISLFFNPLFAEELITLGGMAAKEAIEKSGKTFNRRNAVDFPTFKLFLFVVTHEVYHQIYRHIERAQHKEETANGKNQELANISMDIEINRDIEIQWPEFAGATIASNGCWEAERYPREVWSLIFDDKYKAGERPDTDNPILPPPVMEQPGGGPDGPQEPGNTYTAPDDYKAGWDQALADIKAGKVNAGSFKPLPVDPSKFDHKVLQQYVVGESLKYGKKKSLNEAASGVNQDEWNQGYNDCIQTWINNMNGGATGGSSGGDTFGNLEQPPSQGGQGDDQNQNGQNSSQGGDSQSNGQNGNQQGGNQQGGGSQGGSQNSNDQNGGSSNGGSQGDFQGSSDEQIGNMNGAQAAQDAINSAKAAQAAAKQAVQNANNSGSASDKAAAKSAVDAAKQSIQAAKDARQAAMEGNKGKARRKAKEARDAAQKASQAAAQTSNQQGGYDGGYSKPGNQQSQPGQNGQNQQGQNGQNQNGNENGSSESGSGGNGRGEMDNNSLDANKSDAKVKVSVEVGDSWGRNDIISKEEGMKIAEEEGQPYLDDELSKSPTEIAKGRLARSENEVREIGKNSTAPMRAILDNIAAALKPPVSNWKAILAQHLRSAGDHRTRWKMDKRRVAIDRADWAEEDVRYKNVKHNAADVFYLVDASGSISDRDLYRTFSEIVSKGGIENRKDMKIRKSAFTYFADRVVDSLIRTWTIDDSTPKKMKLIQRTPADEACGGGTDIPGSVAHVVKLKKYFSTSNPKTILIVFTDGEDRGFGKISALSGSIRKEIIICILNSKNRIPERAKDFVEAGIPIKNIVGIDTESLI